MPLATPLALTLALVLAGCGAAVVAGAPVAEGIEVVDEETLVAPRHLVEGYPALAEDGSLHVVVEIPAGTSAKFEVDHGRGDLRWERRAGRRRVIDFLPYPGNYGFVPSTLSPAQQGGDGDPLDVLILGPAAPRGAVVRARLIGVLRLLDEGEVDDKLIALPPEGPFAGLHELEALRERHPDALTIVEAWFRGYDGRGTIEIRGWEGRAAAERILEEARLAFRRSQDHRSQDHRSRGHQSPGTSR